MKRKVIQIAESTQLISLPRLWAKKYNISKGDELEVTIKDNILEISTEQKDQLSEIIIDISNLDRTSVFYALRSAYRRGYDIIKVKFNNKTTIHYRTGEKVLVSTLLNQELQRWVGMQIIEQKENYFVYKSISKPSFEEFDLMLRRSFLLLLDACDEFVKAVGEKDTLTLGAMDEKFYNILIFITYCQRLLNKIGYSEKYKNSLLYVILLNLNKIGDILRYSARDAIKLQKTNPKTVNILKDIFSTVRIYYDLFYKFDFTKFTQIYKMRDTILRDIDAVKKTVTVEELMLLVYSRQVLEILVHNIEATSTFYLEEKQVSFNDSGK